MAIALIMSIIGIFIGGLITWYVARKYYIRASDDLRQESMNLRVLSNVLVNFLAHNKLIEIERDKQGHVLGYIIPVEKNGRLVLNTYFDPRKGSIEFKNVSIGGKKRTLKIDLPRDKKTTQKDKNCSLKKE